jgi:hypothetical protein
MSEDKKKYYLPEDVWEIIKYDYLGLVSPYYIKMYSNVSIMSLYDIHISCMSHILYGIKAKNHPFLVEPTVGNYESYKILTKEQLIQLIWQHLLSKQCNEWDRLTVYDRIYSAIHRKMG